MRKIIQFTLCIISMLLPSGCLSYPRNFSSPHTRIRIVDEHDRPIMGVTVARSWEDSDRGKYDRDELETDSSGVVGFPNVPAKVGLFTGSLKNTLSFFTPCFLGSGTETRIMIRYHGRYRVFPKGKTLHPTGLVFRDPDGVWFDASNDNQSNTLIHLTFPPRTRSIDYTLVSIAQ